LARFSCWCPKIIAAIGRLPDTLADRCIPIRMQRKTAAESCERVREFDGTELRRKCARFVRDHAETIRSARPALPRELNDRAADIWEPLLALADAAGGDWPTRARQAAIGLVASARDRSPIGSLLLDIFLLFLQADQQRLFTRTLVEGLNRFADRPWRDLAGGKIATEMWLARQLRPYGVLPRTLRIGQERAKGYVLAEMHDILKRYIPKSEVDALREEQNKQAEKSSKLRGRGAK
jgi:hypothetical protein